LNKKVVKLIIRSKKCQEEFKKIQEKKFKEIAANVHLNQTKQALLNVRVLN
jgi:hypothetical protein